MYVLNETHMDLMQLSMHNDGLPHPFLIGRDGAMCNNQYPIKPLHTR